jgi:hypothetical protein
VCVAVGVGVGVGVFVAVDVGVAVSVGVGVLVGVGVSVGVGVRVGVSVFVGVGVKVMHCPVPAEHIALNTGNPPTQSPLSGTAPQNPAWQQSFGPGVCVGVGVAVLVGEAVAVGVLVGVGVSVAQMPVASSGQAAFEIKVQSIGQLPCVGFRHTGAS